jgi:hypothetical protein
MKKVCDNCGGTGRCPECDGGGFIEAGIDAFINSKSGRKLSDKVYTELQALLSDEKRIKRQAAELIKLQPQRRNALEAQMESCLLQIHKQAEDIAGKGG